MTAFPDNFPKKTTELESIIASHEDTFAPIKPEARARIVWHDEQQKTKTDYSLVYLHGFKSSQGEGHPVHQTIAKKFGCNLYLARLQGHGLERGQYFGDLSSSALIQSAIDACRIGQKIGRNVLVMGTSTGGSLALYAAASDTCPVPIKGLILYSPLIHLYGFSSLLLENRIGRTLLQIFPGKDHELKYDPFTDDEAAIWYSSYSLNGALALGQTIQQVMRRSVFSNVRCPVFTGYYYKDRAHHDRVVSTSAIKRMVKQLGTPSSSITIKNFPHAASHVICSSLLSNAVQDVIESTSLFMQEKVDLSPVIQ